MADEETTVVETDEVVAPEETEDKAVAATEETEDDSGDDQPPDEDSDEEVAAEVEEREFDFGGNKLRVAKDSIPDEVADEIDKFTKGTWADYTRKSQAVADKTKELEARSGAVEKLASLQGESLDTFSRGLRLREELTQLSEVDLTAMWQSNPDQARQFSDGISTKQAELNSIIQTVSQQEAAMAQAQETEVSRRMDEGRVSIEKRIKGFGAKASEVVDYVVKEFGMSQAEAETWPLNPMTAEMAYKAMMYDRMQARAAKAAKPKPAQAKPVKPIKGKGGPNQSATPSDKDDVDTWLRKREAQLRKRAG